MHRASGFIDIVSSETPQASGRQLPAVSEKPRSQPTRRSVKKLLEYTIEEVEAANRRQKAWVAIRGNVYDLTSFVDKHPGGADFLLASVGRDATAMYESIHDEKNTKVLK